MGKESGRICLMGKEKYIKYGGMEFKAKADPKEINNFVANLPPEKKVSMFTVVGELQEKGLIEIEPGSFSSIDDEMLPFMK
jgi:hypothetical protein